MGAGAFEPGGREERNLPNVTLVLADTSTPDCAPKVSAPPDIPDDLSVIASPSPPPSPSTPLAAGLYPMIPNVLTNPAALQPGGKGGASPPPPVLRVFTNQPWHPGHLALWGGEMQRLRKDAGRCVQLFSSICTGHNPNWSDTQILLRELFQPNEGDKIIKDAEEAQQAGGNRNLWLANDPNWDYNNAGDRAVCPTGL